MINTGSFTTDTLLHVPGILAYVLILMFVIGSVMASFITCMADRILTGETMKGRSHCASCGHVLTAGDLIPVISWIALKGKCRYCGAKIPKKCVLFEAGLGAAFVLVTLRFGLSFDTARVCGILVCLLGLSITDLDSLLIPDRFWIAIVVITLITAPFVRHAPGVEYTGTTSIITPGWTTGLIQGIIGGVIIAGAVLIISLIMDKVLKKESMGGGDIKLLFAAGFVLGPAGGLLCLILACIIGLVVVVARHSEQIPFGPSIAASLAICMLFGEPVIDWYLGLLGL